ncbi:MAG: TonB C-terminal domain-containing protein, partial [Gemmatimonadaceae bacterium]
AALVLLAGQGRRAPTPPPSYSVNIVAAPPGERQIGEVRPTPAHEPPAEAPPPPPRAAPPEVKNVPPAGKKAPPPRRRATPRATPSVAPPEKAVTKPTPAPTAGGGPTGGAGTDVATVRTEGTAFQYPGYLNNIVRQIALRFKPPGNNAALRAEVMFLIRRDGSVTGLQITHKSGVYAFDLEARAAVEAAARANAFGPLPDGFGDDVLPVYFSFDPRVLR